MTADLDLCFREAGDLAALIRARKLSPVELIENSLARIEAVNPTLNCFCFVWAEEARAAARAAEARLMQGGALPPLLGVPIAFKDVTPTKGHRTTLGSRAYEHNVPDHDAIVVERLTRAGAIIVGKTTTPEFAFSSFTQSPLWGITRNPWDPGRSPGGSSGGAGAAVSSGCVPFAEGSDMGGSIRIPAALCGVVGLKPSFGRIPFEALPSQLDTLNHFGPLARSVADAALFLRHAAGPDERDLSSNPQLLDWSQSLAREARGLRLAVSDDLGFYAVQPDVRAAFREGVERLRAAGAAVEDVALPWSRELVDRWNDLWAVFMAAYFGHLLPEWRDRLDPRMVTLIESGFALEAVPVKRIEVLRSQMWAELRAVLAGHDALLCPTTAVPAPPNERSDDDSYGTDPASGRYRAVDMTSIFNLVSQCPALSVPCGFAEGLPVGLQVVGRRFDDLTVLRIGAALEDARGPYPRAPF